MGTDNQSGYFLQATISLFSYIAIGFASLFDEQIREDMDNIGWNIFNDDAEKTISAEKVSFYKGVPVFMVETGMGSMSLGAIFLDELSQHKKESVLKHERGHNTQLMELGLIKYLALIGIPSVCKNGDETPWELSASMLGGSELGEEEATLKDKLAAINYLIAASSDSLHLICLLYFIYA